MQSKEGLLAGASEKEAYLVPPELQFPAPAADSAPFGIVPEKATSRRTQGSVLSLKSFPQLCLKLLLLLCSGVRRKAKNPVAGEKAWEL